MGLKGGLVGVVGWALVRFGSKWAEVQRWVVGPVRNHHNHPAVPVEIKQTYEYISYH